MTNPIDTLLAAITPAAPLTADALFMIPLFPPLHGEGVDPDEGPGRRVGARRTTPLTLDEALAADLLDITETSDAGAVPELAALNRADRPVFLLDGEQVTGVKQNRTFNLSMLLAAGSRTTVPVSCLEHGRWSMRRGPVQSARHVHFAAGRAAKLRSVSFNLAESRSYRSDQGRVWDDISERMQAADCHSETFAEADLHAFTQGRLDPLARAFPVQPGQCGAVFGIGDRIVGLDLFADPGLYARVADKLVRSYGLDAIHARAQAAPPADLPAAVTALLDSARSAPRRPFPAPGLGETWRLEGETLAGAALVHGGQCVHLAVFA